MVKPWLDAGYECWIVDVQHPVGIVRAETRNHLDGCDGYPVCRCAGRSDWRGLVTVGADVRRWLPPRREYAFACAFPPCTDQAVSGARWFKDKGLAGLAGAIELVEACRNILEWTGAPWLLENPVGTISSYWRKPDYTFQPWHFGDLESKQTCLWTGSGFVMPSKRIHVKPEGVKESTWLMPPSPDRGDKRSVTPAGFAEAVFMANAKEAYGTPQGDPILRGLRD